MLLLLSADLPLFSRLRDLFNLEVGVVFYDLTSSHFKGDGPPMAAYGYSRDKRPDRRQVLLALACDKHGFPVAHEVLPGNRADVSTVRQLIAALRKRFRLRHIIFVSDNGMVSKDNLRALDEANYEYLVAVRKHRIADPDRYAPADLSVYESVCHRVRAYMTEGDTPGTRYVCCYSEPRAEEERQIRQARLDRGQEALEKIAGQVASGRLKEASKIAAQAATALQKAAAHKYFEYEPADGAFSFRVNEAQLAAEQRLAGRYFLFTNAARFNANDAVEAFFTLQEVERAFREMKDLLRLRPIYHWADRRVRAHILVCVLAYLLERSFSHQLREAKVEMSPREGLDWLSRIHASENKLGELTIWTVSRPAPQAYKALQAVGIRDLPAVLGDYTPVASVEVTDPE